MNIKYLDLRKVSESFQPELSACVGDVVLCGTYLYGPRLNAFERVFADYTGNRHCIGVGNGFDALKISLMALKELRGWDRDVEVIVPSFTFIATALAVNAAGLTPIFCDVDENGLMVLDNIRTLVTERTRCIIPVHLYGKMCDICTLQEFAEMRGLVVLEDAAQCHGASSLGIKPGNRSVAAAFSFYPAKNLGALADAGAIVTNDDMFADAVRRIANYGSEKKYAHGMKGVNSRLDEINAAVLSLKLRRLDRDNMCRKIIAKRYSSGLNNPSVIIPYGKDTEESVFHIYPLRVEDRDGFRQYMLLRGIETAVHYPIPCHRQKAFSGINELVLPYAEDWARHEVSLPISPILTDEEIGYIIDTVNDYRK